MCISQHGNCWASTFKGCGYFLALIVSHKAKLCVVFLESVVILCYKVSSIAILKGELCNILCEMLQHNLVFLWVYLKYVLLSAIISHTMVTMYDF